MEFIKGYICLMLLFRVVAYLTPREEYRKYFRFFLGILLAVAVVRPVLGWVEKENFGIFAGQIDELFYRMNEIEYQGDNANVYEIFWGEGNLK